MFYLLEDNRIIKYSEKFSHIFCYENRKGLLYKVFSDKNYGKNRKIGKIKKQSENVYDLIDLENDIVKYKFREEDIISKAVDASLSYIIGSYPEDVIAIYKPNSNGDYIKVWEKKMEV